MTDDSRAAGTTTSRLWRLGRRVLVVVLGIPIVIVGLVLLVTPGPGIPVLLAGLAILAIEFAWPRRQMDRIRDTAKKVISRPPNDST